MAAPALPWTFLLLGILPGAGGRVGEGLFARSSAGSPNSVVSLARVDACQRPPAAVLVPDTARKPALRPDTVQTRPAAVALVPDQEEKLTRRSALYTMGAIAALTLTTLLLYNVRSR